MSNVKLVLGTMTFGESVFSPDVEQFVNTFLDAGYDELDTAYVYNDGNCERLLGEVLPGIDKHFKIATKVNPRISGKLDGEAAYKQVKESLERMKLSSVDTVFLHFPDPATPVISVLEAMADLHKKGKFKELGLSNFPAWMVADVWHICDKHGWVKPTAISAANQARTPQAQFAQEAVTLTRGATATDDPDRSLEKIISLVQGERVTALGFLDEKRTWIYCEFRFRQGTTSYIGRGFLPADALQLE